ncbi:MAG TPA: hypothetical protein VKP00_06595 [Gemmatimonadaceae bacterium]|nr:hypothetical protein [Gemmatimonadaceae bacterium]
MLGRWLLLLACPVASLTAQSTRVRVTIGDRLGQEEYQLVTSGRLRTALENPPALGSKLYARGRTEFLLESGANDSVTVFTADSSAPVHVSASSGRAVVNAVGAMVTVRALGDSLSVETRDRSFLPSSVRQRP